MWAHQLEIMEQKYGVLLSRLYTNTMTLKTHANSLLKLLCKDVSDGHKGVFVLPYWIQMFSDILELFSSNWGKNRRVSMTKRE